MSQLYDRMLLIKPDVFEKSEKGASSSSSASEHLLSHPNKQEEREAMSEDDGSQGTFIRREMIKDSLSPIAPTVNVLEHLEKVMARVLKDPTMDTEEKLATYDDLMTRSQILTSKSKSMTTEPYTSGDETEPQKRPIPVREKNKKNKSSAAIPEPLLKEIDKIPLQANSEETLQCPQHWKRLSRFTSLHKKRSYVPEGNVQLDKPALARLLTTVVRPTGKKRPDLPHQKAFLGVLKKINPKMRYIRNKTLDNDASPTPVPQQAGDGFRKKRKPFVLKWSTRL